VIGTTSGCSPMHRTDTRRRARPSRPFSVVGGLSESGGSPLGLPRPPPPRELSRGAGSATSRRTTPKGMSCSASMLPMQDLCMMHYLFSDAAPAFGPRTATHIGAKTLTRQAPPKRPQPCRSPHSTVGTRVRDPHLALLHHAQRTWGGFTVLPRHVHSDFAYARLDPARAPS
jgi:hypothetical protein